MPNANSAINRREAIAAALAASAVATTSRFATGASSASSGYEFCAFEKFLQALSYEEMAEAVADIGFDGVEATVRKGGHVEPERVEDDLPRMVEALGKNGLSVRIMTTDVLDVDTRVNQRVLRTAANLDIGTYRMGFYTYDKTRPVMEQIDGIRPRLRELADFNRELGVGAVYQNHSDAKYVGATLWDLYLLIKDLPVDQIASAFDIRHATIEAGLSWPTLYRLMRPHIGAIFVKDFQWDGKKARHVPLGEGRVDPEFFEMLRTDDYSGPISVHVEYLPDEGVQANIEALQRDLATLRKWLS